MSTAQEIIDIADTTYRNNISSDRKIKWLNFMLKQLFQLQTNYKVTEEMIEIQKNIQFYEIPANCEADDIRSVTIETMQNSGTYETIDYHNVGESARSGTYTIIEGMMMIEPIPDENKTGYIFFVAQPTLITSANLDAEVDLDPAYHEILVHGLNERYAATRRDALSKNNFNADYNALLGDFLWAQLNKAPEYASTHDAMPRRGRYGRKMVNPFYTSTTD
jgi:hypothetical protein